MHSIYYWKPPQMFNIAYNRYVLFENGKERTHAAGSVPDLLSTSQQVEFDLTIVVPAYNEEKRLPTMFDETLPVRKN